MIFKISTPFRFAAAVARTVFAKLFGYQVVTPSEEWDNRLAICSECDYRDEDDQCMICTCFVPAKTALALEQCPKKKWLRVWKKRTI